MKMVETILKIFSEKIFKRIELPNEYLIVMIVVFYVQVYIDILQFLNTPGFSFDVGLSSTPVKEDVEKRSDSELVTPDPQPLRQQSKQSTPKSKRSLSTTSTPPRTPTPFKHALAEMEKKRGAVKYQVIVQLIFNYF